MDDLLNGNLSPATPSKAPKLQLPATCDPPSESNPPKQTVWIIFGATGHLGHSLVRAALRHGDRVTAVGWTEENKIEQMSHLETENCQPILCDVRVRSSVSRVIDQCVKRWGSVGIIANCTGYGVIAPTEDQSEYDLRNQFETNFLGVLHILQCSLPIFRTQLHGRYLIFSSTAGALGVPGLGPYCATKYAVEGLIESILYEVDAFNIKATLVEPGHVRLDDTPGDGAPFKRYGQFLIKPASAPYNDRTAPAGHAKRLVQWLNDRQPTSAVKSAELVWQLGHCSYPPLRLLLGSYAVDSIRDRLRSIIEEIEDWKHLSFPVAPEDVEADDAGRDGGEEVEMQDGD